MALAATSGDNINLARLTGRSVVAIYPWTGRDGLANPPGWDTIPGAHGSTPQLAGLGEQADRFARLGFRVLALSGQDSAYQLELAQRLKLPFPILSDADLAFASALRLPMFATGGVRYLRRLTLLIADGAIMRTFYPVHPPDTHGQELISRLS